MLILSDLLENLTMLIHQSIHTPCQSGFGFGRFVGSEVVASPCLITPDQVTRCTALDHNRHSV